MGWIKKGFPLIAGYESLGDTVEAKRFLDFKINELLDTGDPVWEFRSKLKTRKEVCDFVITEFDYPFHLGVPTDKHLNNWFEGNCCHQLTDDYWQSASDTLTTLLVNQRQGKKGFGDCEDVAMLFVTLFLEKKWGAYGCLGYVMEDGQILGGHSWGTFKDDAGAWRLYEATLDTPPRYPDGYPAISIDDTEWKVGDITYKAGARFNRRQYYEDGEMDNPLGLLLSLALGSKETRKKHEAISRAWGQKTKPLAKAGLLSRVRWK
jgi:hypothetical protein